MYAMNSPETECVVGPLQVITGPGDLGDFRDFDQNQLYMWLFQYNE